MFRKSLIATAMFAGLTSTVLAAPFMALDPRTMGMGGTAVSSATSNNASLYNPALLAVAQEDEDFSFQIPVAARIADPDDLQTAVDDFNTADYVGAYQTSYDAFVAAQTAPLATREAAILAAKDAYVASTKNLVNGLDTLSGKDVEMDIGANVVISIPSRKHAFALTAGGWTSAGIRGNFKDSGAMLSLVDALDAATDPTNTPTQTATALEGVAAFDANTMESDLEIRGILARELGISMAREFNVFGQDIAFGLTPKFVQVTTYDAAPKLNDNAGADLDQGEKDGSGFTMDFGMARDFGNNWKTGFTVKNLIPQSYDTALGNKIDVNPMARVGVSRSTDRTAIALDLDLTENDPTSLGNGTQYLSIGGELDLWLLELRAGYRANIPDSSANVATVGVGLYVFGVNLDVGAAAGSNEYGASAQLGFSF